MTTVAMTLVVGVPITRPWKRRPGWSEGEGEGEGEGEVPPTLTLTLTRPWSRHIELRLERALLSR